MSTTNSKMGLRVDFLPSTALEDAIREAKQKAELLNVAYIRFDFNGTVFSIGRNANILDVLNRYLSNPKEKHICN